jgi:hypothetical protein
VGDEGEHWLRRAAAAKLLAACNRLAHDSLLRLWRRAPRAFQPDLVEAAVLMASHGTEWASAFVDGCRGDRVADVVIGHLS